MYPLGVPTAEGIISAITHLFKAYSEARQADKKFETAKQILNSLDLSLSKLEDISSRDDSDPAITFQVTTAREAWRALEQYLQSFESGLGNGKNGSTAVRTYKRTQWALNELDGKIKILHHRIEICFTAIVPTLQANTFYGIQELLQEVGRTNKASRLTLPGSNEIIPTPYQDSEDDTSVAAATAVPTISVPCWQRKKGCLCRCHTNSRITNDQNRHFFVDAFGLSALSQSCNVVKCSNRRYGLQIRLAVSKYGLPLAIVAAIEFHSSWLPTFTLSTQTVRKYTSPGFRMLWELQKKPLVEHEIGTDRDWTRYQELHEVAIWQKVADIKRLFVTGEAAFTDVDPSGEGWIEKVLRAPWSPLDREAQWALVEFLVRNSPTQVLTNSKPLYRCAKWIGEGPHMDMLETLLSFGVDPNAHDGRIFQEWPEFCSPGWYAEVIAPDPMFVEWIRKCIHKAPEFAGCDNLIDTMLTKSVTEFDKALAHATDTKGILRTTPNVFGQTAIHLAILFPTRLEKLLKAGMDPDAVDRGGSTPLMYAACYGASESVMCLLNYGAHPGLVDQRNKRVFVDYAIRRGHLHVIEELVNTLRQQGDNHGAMAVLDRSLRYYFVNQSFCHDIDGCRLRRLFALDADPDIHIGSSSLAHLVTSEGEMHILLDNGFTSIESRNDEGATPLMKVVSNFDIRSTKLLIEKGANINCQDSHGWTELHHLLRAGSSCDLYAPPVAQCDETLGRRKAMIACMHLLLKSNADITIRDHCTCACSSNGCSATTVALHRTTKDIGLVMGPQDIPGTLFDLLCVLQNRMVPGVETILGDLSHYRRFLESGLEHSCCYRQRRWLHSKMDFGRLRSMKHTTFNKSFDNCVPTSVFDRNEIIREVAQVVKILETHSLKAYTDAVEKNQAGGTKRHSVRYEVDEKSDTFTESYGMSTLPPLSKLNIDNHRQWLWRAAELKASNGLHQRGTVQAYVENALALLSDIEGSMHDLQSRDNPEQIQIVV